MPSINNGPAQLVTQQSTAVIAPSNTSGLPVPAGAQAIRLLGVVKGLSVATVGDAALLTIINASNWAPTTIVTSNANVTMATASIGLYTAPAAGGSPAVHTTAVLTGQTTNAFVYARAASGSNNNFTAQTVYVNVSVAVATGTVDLYLYGYDLSVYTP